MKEKKRRVVVTFYTTAEAMAVEKLCKSKGIAGRLFSAPRSLSADCGIAWRSDHEYSEALRNALTDADIEYAGLYELMI